MSEVERENRKSELNHNDQNNPFFSISHDLLCVLDSKGRIIKLNNAWEHHLGYSKTDLNNIEFEKIIHCDDLHRYREVFTKIDESETIVLLNRIKNKNGTYNVLSWNFTKFQDNIYGAAKDVYSRGNEEQQEELVVRIDKNNQLTYVNNALSEFIGRDKEELIGCHLDGLLTQATEQNEILPTLCLAGKKVDKEQHFHTPQGMRVVEWKDYEIKNEKGEILEIQRIGRDISAFKQAIGRAEAETVLKGQFLANMSHEIRTPMNGILGMIHLAKMKSIDKEVLTYLQKIQLSSQNLLGILNDILDYSKMETGNLVNRAFFIRKIVKNILDIFSLQKQNSRLHLRTVIDSRIPSCLWGDPLRINQILTNLIGNAVKFTYEGEITIAAHLQGRDEEKIQILFAVKDTGIGIPKEKHKLLFQPFYQASTLMSENHHGTGLGLSITKRLVELMGGSIWLESVPEQGSTFYFTVPFAQKTDVSIIQSLVDSKDFNVLIIEDEPRDQQIFGESMSALNLEYRLHDSQEALNKKTEPEGGVFEKPADLVFLPYQMVANNHAKGTLEKKYAINFGTTPTILTINENKDEDEVEDAKSIGNVHTVVELLHKPLQPTTVLQAIIELFSKIENMVDKFERVKKPFDQGLAGHSVLIVEDNQVNREIAQEILSNQGLHVTAAKNGAEAVALLGENDFELILMDIQMPEMDGYQATRMIRSMPDSQKNQTPIIAMTAHAMAGDREQCFQAGMDDYLSKPVEPEALIHKVALWLHKKRDSSKKKEATKPSIPEAIKPSITISDCPSLNPAEGLRRLGGNRKLYRMLLHTFLDDLSAKTQAMVQQAEKGDWDQVNELAHTIKGSSGNVGALAVMEICKNIQGAIVWGDTPRQLIQALLEEKSRLGQAIEALVIDDRNQEPVVNGGHVDGHQIQNEPYRQELLARFYCLLQKDLFIEDDFLAQIIKILAHEKAAEDSLHELKQSIDNFDYKQAQAILMQIEGLPSMRRS
ncbi:response regulator [Heliophilum fasciatum]|uniref:Circadian input-output histidine kinase CikA n=1 Tax=Heliophilum fasciatum TaxID=35700 RepID=A0A4R2RN32_9FIRM|nr:response regulator [Heliophilum fasciatum]MCW2277992.1 PAS domain S-box-containing protein [Heliophilum fasciatum]TCP64388.1 PAS domain S-box-containing protein [Heliophilum fasciatum]